ncbi:MAG: protein translocase subunit SecF [Acidobacteria bacterium]|nr:MAG: protein translocase subunit SecF [Acidobacteriota bacterium]
MELFKNTNFDFLGKKWPFIIASLVLTAAGIGSLIVKHGPSYGIDFNGGALMYLRFNQEPPIGKIRSALVSKIHGDVSVQQITGRPEVLVGTEVTGEKELNTNRQIIEDTLRSLFGDSSGKLDLNNASDGQIADRLRDPLLQANVPLSEQQLQDLVKAINAYRASKGGILHSIDELSTVPGVNPAVLQSLKQQCTLGPFTILSAEVVGPKIGADLRRQAILATLYALGGMLVYIAFRFEWIYGVAAVVAVFHDTIITIGLFSLFNKQISLTVVAALLTLVGYSMNDTIVVFDRIRENLKILRRESLENLINISVNQTLSRTVLTSGLTLLTALSLFLFGGQVLNGFSFALVVGIIVGTYSSIFIASPILVFWQNFLESRKRAVAPPAKETAGSRKVMRS